MKCWSLVETKRKKKKKKRKEKKSKLKCKQTDSNLCTVKNVVFDIGFSFSTTVDYMILSFVLFLKNVNF